MPNKLVKTDAFHSSKSTNAIKTWMSAIENLCQKFAFRLIKVFLKWKANFMLVNYNDNKKGSSYEDIWEYDGGTWGLYT